MPLGESSQLESVVSPFLRDSEGPLQLATSSRIITGLEVGGRCQTCLKPAFVGRARRNFFEHTPHDFGDTVGALGSDGRMGCYGHCAIDVSRLQVVVDRSAEVIPRSLPIPAKRCRRFGTAEPEENLRRFVVRRSVSFELPRELEVAERIHVGVGRERARAGDHRVSEKLV